MSPSPLVYLGLLPILFHGVSLYVAYRMPHGQHTFWIWIFGWLAFAGSIGCYSVARISVVLDTVRGRLPYSPFRTLNSAAAAFMLMLFVLAMRAIFLTNHSLWDAGMTCVMTCNAS